MKICNLNSSGPIPLHHSVSHLLVEDFCPARLGAVKSCRNPPTFRRIRSFGGSVTPCNLMYMYRSFKGLSCLLRNRILDTGFASPLQESRSLAQRTPVAVRVLQSSPKLYCSTLFFGGGETEQRTELILCLAWRKNRNGIEEEREKWAQIEVVGEWFLWFHTEKN
jgi:hypothetical protein